MKTCIIRKDLQRYRIPVGHNKTVTGDKEFEYQWTGKNQDIFMIKTGKNSWAEANSIDFEFPDEQEKKPIFINEAQHLQTVIGVLDEGSEQRTALETILKNLSKFPNGFESWMETHHEIVAAITEALTADELEPEFQNVATRRREEQGIGGVYELAEELTDKFEQLNKGREWDGEFFDEITEFLKEELNKEG